MVFKLVLTASVVFMATAKLRQIILTLVIIFTWTIVVKVSSPYISPKTDATDFASKLSQLGTTGLSLIAVLKCDTHVHICALECYAATPVMGPGYVIGIITNVFAGACLLYIWVVTVKSMPFYSLMRKNYRGLFEFTDHSPASHLDKTASSLAAPLIYDLHREKKFRVWHPFWDGVMDEMATPNDASE